MIRHIVLIRFRPEVTEGQIADIFAALGLPSAVLATLLVGSLAA